MATTTNFGWETPDDTDLVKDGALAMRTLGNAIDASLVDLKGGTTGQVLSKTSNTDMDFTWVTSDDANAIQNAIVDAKGDLITATGSDVPARLAVGSNGDTLVADSAATTGLRWQGSMAAGKNAVINGAFDIWQRGTSFSGSGYNADRWLYTGTFPTGTISRVTVSGVTGISSITKYALRYNMTVAGGGYFGTRIEGAGWGNGQTVTLSFLARNNGASAKSIGFEMEQYFGTGGSPSSTVVTYFPGVTVATGSTFVRYTTTVALPSTAGKTFGSNNDDFLSLRFYDLGVANIDFTEIQLEVGSVATTFTRTGGTLQGERAACMRYYQRFNSDTVYAIYCVGAARSTTQADFLVPFSVPMRTSPSSTIDYASLGMNGYNGDTVRSVTALVENSTNKSPFAGMVTATHAGTNFTTGNYYRLFNDNTTAGYLGFSAEL
jgi:hypothetical protein